MFEKFLKIIPRAKLPFNFFKVLDTETKGWLSLRASVIKSVITSVSVCDLNFNPFDTNSLLISSEFSIIPLWTTDTCSDECGCALTTLGTPCVAHLTCPIPIFPLEGVLNKIFSNSSTLPEHYFSLILSFVKVAKPAES